MRRRAGQMQIDHPLGLGGKVGRLGSQRIDHVGRRPRVTASKRGERQRADPQLTVLQKMPPRLQLHLLECEGPWHWFPGISVSSTFRRDSTARWPRPSRLPIAARFGAGRRRTQRLGRQLRRASAGRWANSAAAWACTIRPVEPLDFSRRRLARHAQPEAQRARSCADRRRRPASAGPGPGPLRHTPDRSASPALAAACWSATRRTCTLRGWGRRTWPSTDRDSTAASDVYSAAAIAVLARAGLPIDLRRRRPRSSPATAAAAAPAGRTSLGSTAR